MTDVWVYNSTPDVSAASHHLLIFKATTPLVVVMIIMVITRLYVKIRTVRGVGADDWTLVIAAVCAIVYNALTIAQSRWGLSLPVELRPAKNLNRFTLLNFVGRPFYVVGILAFKVSLCFSYLRILSMGQPKYRLLVWIVMAVCILGHVVGSLLLIFSCNPVARSWQPATTPGKCIPIGPLLYGLAIMSIAFDVAVFILPMPFLYSLRMDARKKIGVIAAFALGLFTAFCSIRRMGAIDKVANGGDSSHLVLWGNVELNVGIILTCIPVLAPLLKVFGKKCCFYGKSGSTNPSLLTVSHNLQVFSNNRSHQHHTNINANASTRAARAMGYEDVSDDECQETISGKRQVEEGKGRVETGMETRDSDGSKNGEDFEGILKTRQVTVTIEERKVCVDGSGGGHGHR
ncbi:hypothetical protein DSL72_006708 [Monilinia vaccinii-corymbosi]|uniref:Rhodopsin domain-containing protein n=1 Tax=Monilinia vaccinii-corymbosi TaxID=61207 RepID=A0A8A3PPK2_9HELO|nr:hypothetical protein DSL72_006708 [Monilinia vaccinii-corymbosi]